MATSILTSAPIRILGQAGASPGSVTGTVAQTTLATIVVPGGSMGLNGCLRVLARYSCTSSTNAKTFKTNFGGTTFISPGTASSGILGFVTLCYIWNRNSVSSQIGFGDSGGIGGIAVSNTGSINTATDQNITITGTLGNTGETITLEAYTVELLVKP